MEDSTQADPAKANAIAQKVFALLINVNSATRRRVMQAVMLLLGETLPEPHSEPSKPTAHSSDPNVDLGEFFNREEKAKPSDNAQLAAAYHYFKYGATPFSLDEVRTIAAEAGVVLPDRLDMTFRKAAYGGKKLFQSAGKGSFRPTASAGLAFKERWGVRPGSATKAS